jgi:hypothetical protein
MTAPALVAVELAFVLAGFAVGFLLGTVVRSRRDRARAGRQGTIDRLIAPPSWDEHVDQALSPWE